MFDDILNIYVKLTQHCQIGELGPPYTYYYADHFNSDILANNIIEIDIEKAGPSICKIMFGKNSEFVKQLFEIEDKKKRSKIISTTLKNYDDNYGTQYINELTLWNKIIVLGYVYSMFDNIQILEYVKDGIVFSGERISNDSVISKQFINFIDKYKITFHENIIHYYIRFNKSSIIKYQDQDKLIVKGFYRNLPVFISDCISFFLDGNLYDDEMLQKVKKVYSHEFLEILIYSNLSSYINQYYGFIDSDNNVKYLDYNNKLCNSKFNINVKNYLFQIVYPVLSLLRSSDKV